MGTAVWFGYRWFGHCAWVCFGDFEGRLGLIRSPIFFFRASCAPAFSFLCAEILSSSSKSPRCGLGRSNKTVLGRGGKKLVCYRPLAAFFGRPSRRATRVPAPLGHGTCVIARILLHRWWRPPFLRRRLPAARHPSPSGPNKAKKPASTAKDGRQGTQHQKCSSSAAGMRTYSTRPSSTPISTRKARRRTCRRRAARLLIMSIIS